MSSAYWRMLTLLREPENWYPRSILIEMVSTSVFITGLKMTTDRGSHTLSLLSLSRLLLLSRSAHDGRPISYVSAPTETETTHTGHFFYARVGEDQRERATTLAPELHSRFPVLRSWSRSPFRVLHFSFAVSRSPFLVSRVRRPTVAVRSE